MAKCIGSGVPGDYWEHGHQIVPGTEQLVFRPRPRGPGSYRVRTLRCQRCTSTRYNYSRNLNFRDKARHSHNHEAKEMVRKGHAPNIAIGRDLMNRAGVTIDFITDLFATHIGKPCPGMCVETEWDGTNHRVIMATAKDMTFDWADPKYPLTPENCGILDPNCQGQKGSPARIAAPLLPHAAPRPVRTPQ